jgi:DNA-directed RNA polymerase
MSAIACKEHGLNFAAAHDSFWTHACDIDTMNRELHEQFIKLHEQPLMENLRDEFIERYKDHMMPASILEEVNSTETEASDPEPATLVNPLDLTDETEELLENAVSDPEPDVLLEEGTMVQTAEPEPELEPVKKKRRTRKDRWVPIEFPPLPH